MINLESPYKMDHRFLGLYWIRPSMPPLPPPPPPTPPPHPHPTTHTESFLHFISSPGRSPGRAIVLPPGSALALAAAVALAKCLSFYIQVFLCDGQGAVRRAILSL